MEEPVEVRDFSTGQRRTEWTWEIIRDIHTISYGISKIPLPETAGQDSNGEKMSWAVPQKAEVSVCGTGNEGQGHGSITSLS